MKKSSYFVLWALLAILPLSAQAKPPPFPAGDFTKIKKFVCDADTIEDLKAIHQTCALSGFTVWKEDINGDGKPEWLFFGPSGECGVHGNCPVAVFQKEGAAYKKLGPEKCPQDTDCLSWANATFSGILKSTHNGYRDLLIAGDSGSFFWTKDIYEWDGRAYKIKKGATTYFIYDSDKEALKPVTQKQWESCTQGGKDCP